LIADYSFLDKEEYKNIPVWNTIYGDKCTSFSIMYMKGICNTEKHRHRYVQIVYILDGRLKHAINNNIFEIVKGDIFVIPPYVPHYYIDESGEYFEYVDINFMPEWISGKIYPDEINNIMNFAYLEPFLVSEKDFKPGLNLAGVTRIDVEEIINKIAYEYGSVESDFMLLIKAYLLKLLVIVSREFKKNIQNTEFQELFDRHGYAITRAIKKINENFNSDITVEEAARISMLSVSYFRYIFKQITHKTFNEYLTDLRISRAIEHLQIHKSWSIEYICSDVGFNNIYHFSRTFKQKTGLSPSAYRNQKLEIKETAIKNYN
jgi:AraC-like DNA-binding protein/mannose-6-phosphate isomerase-like protein (cupin superfamily)